MIWSTRRGTLDLTRHARVMGVLNVTPDSFSDGGLHHQPALALSHARRMIAEGAALIDVGGESTRPGSLPVDAGEEIARTVPLIRALRAEWDGWISIDTSKAEVAAAALEAGVDVVNDVSGLRADPAMPGLCAAAGCAVVVMHMQGEPRTMQVAPVYQDVVAEVAGFFHERFERLSACGIRTEAICFDPGIGFGKTLEHNLTLLRALDRLAPPARPMLLGVSRKSFIASILGGGEPAMRDWPTVAVSSFAREMGVMLHRVHAVQANVQALRMVEAILHAGPATGGHP
jgi:dihydropteroate synthase